MRGRAVADKMTHMLRVRGQAVLALLVGITTLGGCTGEMSGSAQAPGAGGTTSGAPAFAAHPLDRSAARSMEAALASGEDRQLRTVLSVPPGQALDPALAASLKGAALVVEEETFHQIDDRTALVTVRSGGQSPQTWQTTLFLEGGGWKVALTDRGGS